MHFLLERPLSSKLVLLAAIPVSLTLQALEMVSNGGPRAGCYISSHIVNGDICCYICYRHVPTFTYYTLNLYHDVVFICRFHDTHHVLLPFFKL
ncbi:uncharacterized protein LACBIDRAFT_309741 [Laccaria bicolor S238N-H82]|uniref:Predicted protein n=1 Tax=Laccaria bicolor (strain S238N-H82 / ATCC MYA-4686) TaxID=486041 RepID=B0DSZ4_LACBS|nr:uncharacterized protein LACBIDRAFT_309741 [Laccaria bicolor S238N-H82]EDR02405.1 predicted protein [Laccaria bicolor S238N-H82]|eukprot:XP_001887082.1 predicted protein [Laccaria bicolor S238N-H82]